MTARFRRRGSVVTARFTAAEAAILRQVVGEVLELLGGPEAGSDDPLATLAANPNRPTDPVLARLLPDGYRDDPAAAGELRRLTEASLRAEKVGYAQTLLADLPQAGGSVRLADDAAVDAWLRALNDVRLALGTRLGVTEDTDVSSPSAPYPLVVYGWLGWLQETLVRAA